MDFKNFKKLNRNELKKIGGAITSDGNPCDKFFFQYASSALGNIAVGNFASYGATVAIANACDELGY